MSTDEALLPFGIAADTGKPLQGLSDATIESMLGGDRRQEKDLASVHKARAFGASEVALAVGGETDSNDLAQAGWGIIYGPRVDARIKEALQPLIDHRRGEGAKPFVVFDQDGYRPKETAIAWLQRHKVGLDVVNPDLGVPYYLLIVAAPDDIPFEFQYVLDLYWAVGRLWFDTADEFRQYAESVVQYENAASVPTARQIAMFAPEHEFDAATQLFTRQVSIPLRDGEGVTPIPVGGRTKFKLHPFLGEAATKENLLNILRGTIEGGSPALLFSGGHGMEFRDGDALQFSTQGALVCQDWNQTGRIGPGDWFAAADVPSDAKVHGLIHFMFACYGGGVPEFDNFDRLNTVQRRLASRPFFSKLPQALLGHAQGGALAVLAHIERAWAYSFQGDGGLGQVQGFRNVIARILRGDRIGEATDTFNVKWATISTRLSEAQLDREHDPTLPLRPIGQLWVARDDARNFMVLGDPAVRLRSSDMPEL